jgi:hypothetical protein
MTLTSQQELKRTPAWLNYSAAAHEPNGLERDERRDDEHAREQADGGGGGQRPGDRDALGGHARLGGCPAGLDKYLTLATSLTSQLGGGLKSRASRLAGGQESLEAGSPPMVQPTVQPTVQQHQQQQQPTLATTTVGSAPPAQVAPKGRPLNRLAMNRAKFAIRSYTIAVSLCSQSEATGAPLVGPASRHPTAARRARLSLKNCSRAAAPPPQRQHDSPD